MSVTGPLADRPLSKRHRGVADHLGGRVEVAERAGGLAIEGHPAGPSPQRLTRGAFDPRVPFRQLLRVVHPLLLNFRNCQPQAIDLRA